MQVLEKRTQLATGIAYNLLTEHPEVEVNSTGHHESKSMNHDNKLDSMDVSRSRYNFVDMEEDDFIHAQPIRKSPMKTESEGNTKTHAVFDKKQQKQMNVDEMAEFTPKPYTELVRLQRPEPTRSTRKVVPLKNVTRERPSPTNVVVSKNEKERIFGKVWLHFILYNSLKVLCFTKMLVSKINK